MYNLRQSPATAARRPALYVVHYRECLEDERFEKVTISSLVYEHFNACFTTYLKRLTELGQPSLPPPPMLGMTGSPAQSKYGGMALGLLPSPHAQPPPPPLQQWDSSNGLVYSGSSTPYEVMVDEAFAQQYQHYVQPPGSQAGMYHQALQQMHMQGSSRSVSLSNNVSTAATSTEQFPDADYFDAEVTPALFR